MSNPKTIKIDDVEYVRLQDVVQYSQAEELNNMRYVIVRTYSAGVFAGYIESRNNKEGVIRKSRRIWYWDGAASLSQLAMDGTSKPEDCKFPCEVDKTELTEIIEVIECSEKGRKSIQGVPVWKK